MRSKSIFSSLRHTDSLRLAELIFLTARDAEIPGLDECRSIARRNRRSGSESARATALSLVTHPLPDCRNSLPACAWFVTRLPAFASLEHRRNYFTNDQVLEGTYEVC